MDANFWHQRWEKNETAFHESEANPLLIEYFKALTLPKGSRVFVPLCGKTLDIAWLLSKGHRVAGAELSEIAVHQLFEDLGKKPDISAAGRLKRYSQKDVDIFVGDIFDLAPDLLGPVDAVYDRAALVALPAPMRARYTAHLLSLTDKAPQLVICYEYDQNLVNGPPFSISSDELHQHYKTNYDVSLLSSAQVPGGLKGNSAAHENVWLLSGR